MTEQRKISFVFFTEWRHLIKDLPSEVKIEIYEGLSDYVETGDVPDMSPMAAAVFPFLKKRIDENNQKFEEVSQKRKDAREKRNKAQQNSTKADFVEDCKAKTENTDNTQQNSTKSDFVSVCKQKTENADKGLQTPYENENENENENVSSDEDNINPHSPLGEWPLKGASPEPEASFSDSAAADTGKAVHKNPKEKPSPPGSAPPPSPKRSVFTKPTIGEVKAYFAEKGLKSDPEHFYDHFESNGWKVSGKSAMKDWKAAARNWERNESTYGRSNQRKTIRSYRNSDYWTEDEQR